MTKIFFLSFWLLLGLATEARSASDIKIQISPNAFYNLARFDLNTTSTAGYSGFGYGLEVVQKVSTNKYGLGIVGAYGTISLDNSANDANQSETLSGSVLHLGGRFYAVNLYIGLGLVYENLTNTYTGATSSKVNYSGVGFRLETGMDIPMGKTFVFTPNIRYDVSNLSPDSDGATKQRFKNFGFGAGIGVAF